MSKRTDQEEYYYHAKIDRMAQELLDDIRRDVASGPLTLDWWEVLLCGLMVVAVLVSVAGCLLIVFR